MVGRWSNPSIRYGGPHDAASSATGIDPMISEQEKEVEGHHKLFPFTSIAALIPGPFSGQSALSECSMKHYSAPVATLMMAPCSPLYVRSWVVSAGFRRRGWKAGLNRWVLSHPPYPPIGMALDRWWFISLDPPIAIESH